MTHAIAAFAILMSLACACTPQSDETAPASQTTAADSVARHTDLQDVLIPLLEGAPPDRTIYEPPISLERPADAAEWPPRTRR